MIVDIEQRKNGMEIDFQILAQINYYQTKIFEEEDDNFVDGRKIRNYERAITNRLKKLNADEQMAKDIYETFCICDPTYKEQCDRLRARGYTIVNNGKEALK